MKKIYLSAIIFLITIGALAQERVDATPPVINAVAKGKLTEATGWSLKNGKWVSRKNRIVSSVGSELLVDREEYALGENKQNFIYIELREITIEGKSLTIIIKKYNDGDYRYENIKEGWMPSTSIVYYVFETAELEKLKGLDPDKAHSIIIPTLYFGNLYNLTAKSSLKSVAQNVAQDGIHDKGRTKLLVNIKFHKDKTRFLIESNDPYSKHLDFEKSYYEISTVNFEKLFALK